MRVKKSLTFTPDLQPIALNQPLQVETDSFKKVQHHFLQKNKYNNWELMVSGSPEEIGYYTGLLTQDLYQFQEKSFFDNIETNIPSKFKQKLLIKFLRWYNRDMHLHITDSHLREIYMLSQFSSDSYNWVAPKFQRALYLHGAHDIGHAMQDLALVGCSSLAVWGANTTDGDVLIGRNFDFYAGDAFAQNKMVQFVNPDQGFAFASISWPGMVGVVSGMNVKGISVSLNAAKSDIPLKAKTPVSMVARQILEQAENIEQAITIAKSKEVFVSESLLIGSAADNKAVVIEMSPNKFDVYEPNQDFLICTNHFQSETYTADDRNQEHVANSHTQYRFEVIEENFEKQTVWNPENLTEMLRSTQGLNNEFIGLGNEKALNQLMAHHAVLFEPNKLKMWVSSSPYQLGAMVCYDLNQIFNASHSNAVLFDDAVTIPADSSFIAQKHPTYLAYKNIKKEIETDLKQNVFISEEKIQQLIRLNPDLWQAYDIAGRVFNQQKMYKQAHAAFTQALACEIPYQTDKDRIKKAIKKLNKKL
ncbi:C45 family autoproteolytic acyltransferase/hydolase [Flavobacterium agricola]|uniref:C45 family autoproteolytic acyltransferase/hydolase n=1 Tax=Flavobacterium agricola TaxID=2870839 RepID=UPI0022227A23|nr:C45 family peptidase [Flavobacterium agricola]